MMPVLRVVPKVDRSASAEYLTNQPVWRHDQVYLNAKYGTKYMTML